MYEGGCLCGAVRWRVEGRVSGVWLCHCSKCRRSTGSAFAASVLARPAAFRWEAGEENVSRYTSESGYHTVFCRTCGSPVPWVREELGQVFLGAGGLEGPFEKGVLRHIFVGSKAAWWEIDDDLPRFEEHAPGTGFD